MEVMHVIPSQKDLGTGGQVSKLSSFAAAIMGAGIQIELQQNRGRKMECVHLTYTYWAPGACKSLLDTEDMAASTLMDFPVCRADIY